MITINDPSEHILTINDDGSCACSCGEWGYQTGTIGDGEHQISETNIKQFHNSHQNAVIIQIANPD